MFVCSGMSPGRELVVLECADCTVRRGRYERERRCLCVGCGAHASRCRQPSNADTKTFEDYCEECYAHCSDLDGKIEQDLGEYEQSFEAELSEEC